MKLLIVDDSRAMRMLLIRALRAVGYRDATFLQASSADAAWESIHADWPDLVLCDWFMPETSGLDLLRRLNEAEVHVRLGFVTSAADAESRRFAAEEGALFVLNKPFTEEQLEKVVETAVRPKATPERPHKVPAAMPEDASAYAIKRILQHLLHRATTSRVNDHPFDPCEFEVPLLARYERLDGRICGVIVTELSTAARLGAALTLVPPAVIREATDGVRLTGMLDTNMHEVLNVMGQLFSKGGRVQSRLSGVYFHGEDEPDDALSVVGTPKWRSDVSVQIPRYGEGRFILYGATAQLARIRAGTRRITGSLPVLGRTGS